MTWFLLIIKQKITEKVLVMRQFKRSNRLGEQILRDIAQIFLLEFSMKSPDLVTFTHVKLTDDLRYATIYYSCLGDESKQHAVVEFLNREKKSIRHAVGKNLHTRFIPEFSFKFDPSIAEGIKIEKLLNEVKNDTNE